MKKQFTLTAVQPIGKDVLRLAYADGQTFTVDVTALIRRSPVLAPLRQADVFCSARLGEWGGCVVFGEDDTLELAADNLRACAIEQQGDYSHEYLIEWMARHGLTQQQAAAVLGISRRMLGYYLSGARPLPRTVALACMGWETQTARRNRSNRTPPAMWQASAYSRATTSGWQ